MNTENNVVTLPTNKPADDKTESNVLVEIQNKKAVTTSLKVAEIFGKEHKNVLQAIQNLECTKEFIELNFQLNEYKDSIGRTLPCYDLTKNASDVKQQRDATYKELKTVNKHQNPEHYFHLLAKFAELAEKYCAMKKGMQS